MSGLDEQGVPECKECEKKKKIFVYWGVYTDTGNRHRNHLGYLDLKPRWNDCALLHKKRPGKFVWVRRDHDFKKKEYKLRGDIYFLCNNNHELENKVDDAHLISLLETYIDNDETRWE